MDVHTIFAIIRAFLQGFIDCFKGVLSVSNIDRKIDEKNTHEKRKSESKRQGKFFFLFDLGSRNTSVLTNLFRCLILNGGIFGLSVCVVQFVLFPLCSSFSLFGEGSWIGYIISSWLVPLISWLIGVFWILPLFLFTKVVNTLWCQDIADSAFSYTSGKPRFLTNLSTFFADSLFSVIIQSLFLLQTVIIGFIPMGYIGQILILVHISLLYSLYAFEYRWCKTGWELPKRLMFIEANWPYFLGFGLPLALLTTFFSSYLLSACIFAIVFPILIISASSAKPVTNVCTFQLQLFSIVVGISNTICNKTLTRSASVRGRHNRSLQTAKVK